MYAERLPSAFARSSAISTSGPPSDCLLARASGYHLGHGGPGLVHARPARVVKVIDSQRVPMFSDKRWLFGAIIARQEDQGLCKRHIGREHSAMLVGLIVYAADIQDRYGAPEVLKSIRHRSPRLIQLFVRRRLRGALETRGRRSGHVGSSRSSSLRHRAGLSTSCPVDQSSRGPSRWLISGMPST